MRLIDVSSLALVEFHQPNIPKYAIASHRWSVGAETTLSDMQEGKELENHGYQKVKGLATYVREHIPDLKWLWIDTCCIDRKSSSELSEAINSMFRWYRDAEVCLAYLEDVLRTEDVCSFEKSSWFSRGWTLQELLAPSVVVFLSRHWRTIGHKGKGGCGRTGVPLHTGASLDVRIASLTNIPERILEDYEKSYDLSIEEKLEWMRHRQTTREEDLSYCLLGILGVSMNIRYGEGGEATRVRLLKKARSRAGMLPAEGGRGSGSAQDLRHQSNVSMALEPHMRVSSDGVSLTSLALQLAEDGHAIKRLGHSFKDPPASLEETAIELETFAHALHNLESDRQGNIQSPVDDITMRRCVSISAQAINRIRSAVDRLDTVTQKLGTHRRPGIVGEQSEIPDICNELDGAKTSLILAYQLYTEARRRADSSLVLQLLASLGLPQEELPFDAQGNLLQRNQSDLSIQQTITHRTAISRSQPGHEMVKDMTNRGPLGLARRPSAATHDQSRLGRPRQRWRLRFSPWFASRTWELSSHVAQTGWTYSLRVSNLVPDNASIMEACRAGDLPAVQTLFCERQASPFDYTSGGKLQAGETTLSAAARSGNVQLCRYLIEIAGFPTAPKGARDPLDEYVWNAGLDAVDTPDALDMYRLLLSQQERDDDIDGLINGDSNPTWWWSCPGESYLRLIQDRFSFVLDSLPWETRFELASKGRGIRMKTLPAMFLAMLGSQKVDARIATARDSHGRTALHLTASRAATSSYRVSSAWTDFIRDLVRCGAELHQRTNHGHTPLMSFLSVLSVTDRDLQSWISLLWTAGVDLGKYGQAESMIWKASYPNGFRDHYSYGLKHYKRLILGFTFGPEVDDWALIDRLERLVPIYQLRRPPGAWAGLDGRKITTICWHPQREDEDSWPWRRTGEVALYWSARRSHKTRDDDTEDVFRHDPLTAGLVGTQDDIGGVLRVIDRSMRPVRRPRSYSNPSPRNRRRTRDVSYPKPYWFPGCHLCPFDRQRRLGYHRVSRYDFSGVGNDRKCVKGIHPYDGRSLWDFHKGIEEQIRRFRRRYQDRDELHRLPYAAYHETWEGEERGQSS